MSDSYQYFTIPFSSVPLKPTYKVWFATLSPAWPGVEWTEDRPPAGAAWVVGATEGAELPDSAQLIVIVLSTKCIPPPRLTISPSTASIAELRAELAVRLKQLPQGRMA